MLDISAFHEAATLDPWLAATAAPGKSAVVAKAFMIEATLCLFYALLPIDHQLCTELMTGVVHVVQPSGYPYASEHQRNAGMALHACIPFHPVHWPYNVIQLCTATHLTLPTCIACILVYRFIASLGPSMTDCQT